MINPFNFIPIQEEENSFHKMNSISLFGLRFGKRMHQLSPDNTMFLVHKDTYKRLVGFLKPIDRQLEWQQVEKDVVNLMFNNPNKIGDKRIHELYTHVSNQWADRLRYSNGGTLFQYNAQYGFIKNTYRRQIAVHSDLYEKDSPNNYTKIKKISYFKYITVRSVANIICGLNNLFYKKIIFIEQRREARRKAKQLKEFREQIHAKINGNS